MTRIREYRKRIGCLFICIMISVFPEDAQSEAVASLGQSYFFQTGMELSFAWNDQYIYMLQGKDVFLEESFQYWEPVHFALVRADRKTGEAVTLVEDFPYAGMRMLGVDDHVYIFRQYEADNLRSLELLQSMDVTENLPVIGRNETDGTCFILELDLDGNEQKCMRIELGNTCRDLILDGRSLYLATSSKIWDFNLETQELREVYYANEHIRNSMQTRNRMNFCDNKLYIEDGKDIVAVNVLDGTSKILAEYAYELYWQQYPVFDYLVIDDSLIFWDYLAREMIRVDVSSGEKTSISKDVYLFYQSSPDGILFNRIPCEYVNAMYDEQKTWNNLRTLPASFSDGTEVLVESFYLLFPEERSRFSSWGDAKMTSLDSDKRYLCLDRDDILIVPDDLYIDGTSFDVRSLPY